MRVPYRTNILHVIDFDTTQRVLILSAFRLGTIPYQRSSTAELNTMPPQISNNVAKLRLDELTRFGILDIHKIPFRIITLGRFARQPILIIAFAHEGADTAARITESVVEAFLVVACAGDLFAWSEAGVRGDAIDSVLKLDHGVNILEYT